MSNLPTLLRKYKETHRRYVELEHELADLNRQILATDRSSTRRRRSSLPIAATDEVREVLRQLGDKLVATLKRGMARLHARDCVAAVKGLGDSALDYMHQIILAEDNQAPIGSDAVERALTELHIAAVAFTTQLAIAEGQNPALLRRIEDKLVATLAGHRGS